MSNTTRRTFAAPQFLGALALAILASTGTLHAQTPATGGSLVFYWALIFAPYLLLVVAAAWRSAWLALPLLSVPLAGKLAQEARRGELAVLPQKTAQFILVFGVLLVAVVVIVAGLTHFPALTLGPILDHFLMIAGVRL